jgi:hypothetical protein
MPLMSNVRRLMSMPLPINVVIASTNEASFAGLKKIDGLSKPGVSPRYTLATIENPTSKKFVHFDQIDQSQMGYWVALDAVALSHCQAAVQRLMSRKAFDRGFYETHLPKPVVFAKDMKELQTIVNSIWVAFCATS